MEKQGWQEEPYKKEMCDGCGWEKPIAYISETGQAFCLNCMHERYNEFEDS